MNDLSKRMASTCGVIYLFLASSSLIVLCFAIPPFEASDEIAHYKRIIALSGGHIVPHVMPHDPAIGGAPSAGAPIDRAASLLAAKHENRDRNQNALEVLKAEANIAPAHVDVYSAHSNTAIYPPLLYLPSSAGVAIARATDMPVLSWLYIARIANIIAATLIIYWAIIGGAARAPFLMTAGVLPIILFQGATASPDALLMACTLLFCSKVAKLTTQARCDKADHIGLTAATALITIGKVAYLPLALLPFAASFFADRRWSPRVIGYAILIPSIVLAWGVWAHVVQDKVFSMRNGIHVDPAAQIDYILAAPARSLLLLIRTVLHDVPSASFGFVGSRLGLFDNLLVFPKIFLVLAAMMLLLLSMITPKRDSGWGLFLAAGMPLAISYLTIYILLYLQFNPVGSTVIGGFQTRYIAPLALVGLTLMPKIAVSERMMGRMFFLACGWSVISAAVTVGMTLVHYRAI